MHPFRRYLSYANVTATLALVFAMSGGALAAHHYLVESTKQINPKVLGKLKGETGKIGATGTNGAQGTPGASGPQGGTGAAGSAGANFTIQSTLQSGQTETGFYEFWGTAPNSGSSFFGGAVNYRVPLSAALDAAHVIFNEDGSTSAHCSGGGHADAGYLCVYESHEGFGNRILGSINEPLPTDGRPGSGAAGFGMYFTTTGTNTGAWSYGTWAVDAP